MNWIISSSMQPAASFGSAAPGQDTASFVCTRQSNAAPPALIEWEANCVKARTAFVLHDAPEARAVITSGKAAACAPQAPATHRHATPTSSARMNDMGPDGVAAAQRLGFST
ncbi:hypothetical protein FQZ97_1120000 [compost metagenome]